MVPGERSSGHRAAASAIAGLLATFLCALIITPSASAASLGHPASHAAALHKQTPLAPRADAPDVVITVTHTETASRVPAADARAGESDSVLTVSSTRTRGPPANDLR